MTYKERDRMAAELRAIADFVEQSGHKLPGHPYISTTLYLTLTESDYGKNEAGEYVSTLNEDGTKENIRKFLDAVGSCEKNYKDDRLTITKELGEGRATIQGNVDRSIACKRVIKGQKMVPAKLIDEVEYVCDENLSLLKLVS